MAFGKKNRDRRVVISGTYGVGKTTTTNALAAATRMSTTLAKQMREIIAEIYPGMLLEHCSPNQVYQLIVTRFADRKAKEEQSMSGFVSDGSALHEWAYGTARVIHGANGSGSEIRDPVSLH